MDMDGMGTGGFMNMEGDDDWAGGEEGMRIIFFLFITFIFGLG